MFFAKFVWGRVDDRGRRLAGSCGTGSIENEGSRRSSDGLLIEGNSFSGFFSSKYSERRFIESNVNGYFSIYFR